MKANPLVGRQNRQIKTHQPSSPVHKQSKSSSKIVSGSTSLLFEP